MVRVAEFEKGGEAMGVRVYRTLDKSLRVFCGIAFGLKAPWVLRCGECGGFFLKEVLVELEVAYMYIEE